MNLIDSLNFSLEGGLALVTGAGRGNGAAIARGMAKAGARVVAVDIDGPAAEAVAKGICEDGGQAWGFRLDVADREACRSLVREVEEEAGDVTCLVNNAGILRRTRLADPQAFESWDETLAVNVNGPFNVTHAFLSALRRTRDGRPQPGAVQPLGRFQRGHPGLSGKTKAGLRPALKKRSAERPRVGEAT